MADGILNLKRDWGVVPQLIVEGDTEQVLRGALMIITTENKKATHYKVEQWTDGSNELQLFWTDVHEALELPFTLVGIDPMSEFICRWLENKGKWPTEVPDTDGSYHKGFRAHVSGSFTDVIRIRPVYTVYGK